MFEPSPGAAPLPADILDKDSRLELRGLLTEVLSLLI